MSFAHASWLWLCLALPAALVLAFLLYVRRRRRVARSFGGAELAQRLGAGELARFPLRRLLLVAGAAAALGLAVAGPRWGLEPTEEHARALDLVLAMDVSNSMRAQDIQPSRLSWERAFATRTLQELGGDRIGLVAFAGQAYVLSPLTVDHSALQLYIDALDPGILSAGGTAISAGIRQATDLLRGDPSDGRRIILLITDGEALEQQDQVIQAAERARRAGVEVNTVGVGTAAGARVPNIDPETGDVHGWMHDVDGSTVVSKLDEPLLQRVARMTGGTYVHLGEAGSSDRILSALQGMERGVTDSQGRRLEPHDRSDWFIGLALLLLALDVLLTARSAATATRPGEGRLRMGEQT
jgi:Ca-activated chloride channel homolog